MLLLLNFDLTKSSAKSPVDSITVNNSATGYSILLRNEGSQIPCSQLNMSESIHLGRIDSVGGGEIHVTVSEGSSSLH